MRRLLIAAFTMLIASCAPEGGEQAPVLEPEPDPEAAADIGPAQPLPQTLPPPGTDSPRYVGMWATTAEGCAEPAWRFEAERVTTRGEVACEFERVSQTPAGYDIQASCTAEAPPAPYRIQLTFAESARAMMIAGGPWSEGTALVYCSALPSSQ